MDVWVDVVGLHWFPVREVLSFGCKEMSSANQGRSAAPVDVHRLYSRSTLPAKRGAVIWKTGTPVIESSVRCRVTERLTSHQGPGLKQLAELWKNLRLAWRLLRDPVISVGPKLIPLAVLLYVLFPLDFVPDLVPALGQMDDLAVLLLGLRFFIAACPKQAVQRHVAQMDSVKASYTVVESEQDESADRTDHAALALPEPAEEPTLPKGSNGTPQTAYP